LEQIYIFNDQLTSWISVDWRLRFLWLRGWRAKQTKWQELDRKFVWFKGCRAKECQFCCSMFWMSI